MFCADTCHELFLERVMELLSTATHPNIMTKKCDVACSLFSTICDFEEEIGEALFTIQVLLLYRPGEACPLLESIFRQM